MKAKNSNSTAISEVVSAILVIALVVALSMVVYVLISGQLDPKYMQKSVYIAASAQETGIASGGPDPYLLLTLLPKAGDPFYLTGQTTASGTQTTLRILSPDGRNISPDASGLSGSLYGRQLYIYPASTANECQYKITDVKPTTALAMTLPKMVIGKYQIMLIDEKVQVLANTFTTTISKGTTSLPRTVLIGGTTAGASYRADCSQTTGTCNGTCPFVYNSSPCNKTYSTYTGSNYLTFPNDPTLQFTGDMTIGVMIQPTHTAAFTYNSADDWQQIIGKGRTDGNTENDNYQLSLLGDRLGFEWNDPSGNHYNVLTPPATITAAQWAQINVVVQNEQLAIYIDGVPQSLSYYSGNIPGYTPIAPPAVKLLDVGNSVTIGQQNGGPPTNFKGNIGAISLYDRGMSPTEVVSNLCSG